MKNAKLHGSEHLKTEGALIVPSRSGFDTLLALEEHLSGRPLLYLVEESDRREALLESHLGREGVKTARFRAGAESAQKALDAARSHAAQGGLVIYVAAPVRARRGSLLHARADGLRTALESGLPVLPLFVSRPREELTSLDKASDYPETEIFLGAPLPGDPPVPATLIQGLSALSAEAFSQRPLLRRHLGRCLLEGLKRHGSQAGLVDGMDGSRLGYDRVLAAAIAFSFRIRELTKQPRLGIILPPGRAAFIANIATIFAGKVPVNLNYTAGREQVESSIRQSGIDRFLTVDPFVRRMQRFPWPPNRDLVFLERELPPMKGKIARWLVLSKLLPVGLLAKWLNLPEEGDEAEAVLLFTSGSSGDPKGVPLSHRNTLGNTAQFAARLNLESGDSLLGCLPLFHSFGCTVTLWYPAIEGVSLVTFPSPLEVEKLAGLIEEHEISLLLATPTFLRGYLRKAKPDQLKALKLVVTGAEKLPSSLAESFEKRFGKKVMEGYGLTETSPVTNFNLPDAEPSGDGTPFLPSHRPGSVGQLVPGLAIKVTDPDSDAPIPPDQRGVLWFKGANVFGGYLGWGDRNREILEDGWLRTGDLGRLDDDGFLFIEGRLSRFSKIGGEMVPHEKVEEAIVRALGLENDDTRRLVVMGVPDSAKGEALVLLCTLDDDDGPGIDLDALRKKLLDSGMSALWIPRRVINVSEVPVLASGKLDLKSCQQLARDQG